MKPVPEMTFGPLQREAKVYAVAFEPSLRIQTPPVTLVHDLSPEADLVATFAAPNLEYFRAVEAALLEAAVGHKEEWFPKTIDDDTLKSSFKSFVSREGALRTRLADAVSFFDAQGVAVEEDGGVLKAGTQVRALLELSKVSFGKHEFGGLWRVLQLKVCPECLITDAEEPLESDDDFL